MTAAPLSELPPPAPRSSFQPGAATLPRALAGPATQSLSSVDHAWLRMDEATNLMIINGVLVLDGRVDVGRFREVVRERLLTIPRFRERVVRPGTGVWPVWQEAPDFALDRHVVPVRLPGAGGQEALREVIGEWMGEPLDPDHPPWRFYVIEDYEGGSAIVARLHHTLGDGIALMLVLLSLADLTQDAPLVCDPLANPFGALFSVARADLAAVRAATERVMPDGMKLLLHPAQSLRSAGRLLTGVASADALGRLALRRRDPQTVFKGRLGVAKRVAWSESLPLGEMREIAAALGGNMNDVLHGATCGGLRRYLLRHGEAPEALNFRAAVPVNLRPLEHMAELGNRFGLVFLSLPVGMADPVQRVLELRRRMRSLKRSAEPLVVYTLLRALGRSPHLVQRGLVRLLATKTTAVLTSVPGPQQTLYLGGRRIRDLFFWVPQAGRVGLGLSICSYDGGVRLGVATDAGLVPDPQAVVDGIHEELAVLRERAGR
jgi:WS/DGAT/MGAT family acyltransferase